jgi:hypothetical protein
MLRSEITISYLRVQPGNGAQPQVSGSAARLKKLSNKLATPNPIRLLLYYSINIISFTEITVTTTQLTRVLDGLFGGGISPYGDDV